MLFMEGSVPNFASLVTLVIMYWKWKVMLLQVDSL